MKKARADAAKHWRVAARSRTAVADVPGSHGTHVASIAAGNSGVCRKADIAGGPDLAAADDDDRRRHSTTPPDLLDAVELPARARRRARAADLDQHQPRHQRPRARRQQRARPLARCAARRTRAGRSASRRATPARSASETPDDLGYIMGRIHTSGTIAAQGLEPRPRMGRRRRRDRIDVSENELEIWYEPQDRIAVSIRPPGGELDRTGRAGRIHREPAARRQDDAEHLQRAAITRRTAATTSRSICAAHRADAGRRHHGRHLAGAAAWAGHPRRPLPRLDRARRSATGRRRRAAIPGRPSSRSARTSITLRELARLRRTASSRSPISTRSGSAINITSSQGPTRDGRLQARRRRARHRDRRRERLRRAREPWIVDDRHQHGEPLCRGRGRADAGRRSRSSPPRRSTASSRRRRGRCPAAPTNG